MKHCPRKSLRKYAVVCKLNSLMTFSLEELTAKCCLCLPKGRSAWLRVALFYMKHCFQATTTGSCFSLGKGNRKEREGAHRAIEWHENPWDFPSQIPTTTRANVRLGAAWLVKLRWGLALAARGSPAGKAEFQSSSAVKIFPVRMRKPEKPRAAAGMDFIGLAHPFQEQTSKWTSCCWREVMRQCTLAAANRQRIFFYPVLFPWLSECLPNWIPPAFSYFCCVLIPWVLIYIWSKTNWRMSLWRFRIYLLHTVNI